MAGWSLESVQIESEIVGCGSVQMWPESSVSWDSVSEVNKAGGARSAGSLEEPAGLQMN